MRTSHYSESRRAECAAFWWGLYRDMPYVHKPDGYQNVNSAEHIGPDYFLLQLDDGLGGRACGHWEGQVRDDTVFVADDGGKLAGLMVCAVDAEASQGNILSAYTRRDAEGRRAAAALLGAALDSFRRQGLRRAVAAPGVSKSLEAETPIHLALLDEGFRWTGDSTAWVRPDDGDEPYVSPEYGVFLGGPLEGFGLGPEIEKRIGDLGGAGIELEKFTADDFERLYGMQHAALAGRKVEEGEVTFAAIHRGQAVGQLLEVMTWSDGAERGTPRVMGGCVPMVAPAYRGKGVGKALYHLGMAEVVRQGAQYGWTATGVGNTARSIYRSIGYRYWYLCFNRIEKSLRPDG